MALKNMSLTATGTIAVTGGSPLAFTDNGVSIPNGVQLTVPADADYQTRRTVTAKYKAPTVDPKTNKYGKDRKSMSLTKPIVLADGSVVFNVIRTEREIHPSTTAAEAAELNKLGAQMLIDADTDAFWVSGSLS